MFEDDLFKELQRVLGQYRRMQEGFHQARTGLEAATQEGRLPSDPAMGTHERLRSGGSAYQRAGHRLAGVCDRLWGSGRDDTP